MKQYGSVGSVGCIGADADADVAVAGGELPALWKVRSVKDPKCLCSAPRKTHSRPSYRKKGDPLPLARKFSGAST